MKYDIYAKTLWFIFKKSFKKQITLYYDKNTATYIMTCAKNIYK
ncbi:MAG: hypothetical protein AB9856_04770 [Cellulosilyticaceae bacterium]